MGTRIKVTIPSGPLSDTPVDAGGPTAQATLDSFGTSQGFAAFPDPGAFVLSAPGLIAGLLAAGPGGIPPIQLPALPAYPLFVATDAVLTPTASIGAGPYQLTARSDERSSQAEATAGLRSTAFGSLSAVHSEASVVAAADGSVTAHAASEVEGLTVGPLSIGAVRSSASIARAGDGTVAPMTSLSIDVLRVGGIAVKLATSGPGGSLILDVAGIPVPLPIDAVLQGLLSAAGIKVEVLPERPLADGVSAAALRISLPLDLAGIGSGPGEVTIELGSATARLSGSTFEEPPTDLGIPTGPPIVVGGFDGGGAGGGLGLDTPLPEIPLVTPPVGPAEVPTVEQPILTPVESRLAFDIRSLYLMVALLACGVLVTSQIIRLLGVRAPWT
ncbi:MAG: hypothetical protein QOG43_1198 [Actinomycetota bacterium]|jgi:hypothetical protein|nr:hypothetical protein [Actinomycetota bacterium]